MSNKKSVPATKGTKIVIGICVGLIGVLCFVGLCAIQPHNIFFETGKIIKVKKISKQNLAPNQVQTKPQVYEYTIEYLDKTLTITSDEKNRWISVYRNAILKNGYIAWNYEDPNFKGPMRPKCGCSVTVYYGIGEWISILSLSDPLIDATVCKKGTYQNFCAIAK